MSNHEMTELDQYCFGIMDLASLIKEWGAKCIWQDLKNSYPEEYRQMLIQALEELPK